MGSPVTHWQVLTTRPEVVQEFYAALFGWQVRDDNTLGYKLVDTGTREGISGGLWPISPAEGRSMVQLFVRVADVRAHVKQAEALGGKIIIPTQTLPSGDEMAVITDPDGVPFAIFKGTGNLPL